MKEKSPSRVSTEWYSRVGSGEFFLLFPMDLVFQVIRRAFLTAGVHLDPAALCAVRGRLGLDSGFYTTFSLSQGQTIKTGLYWGEQWWGVTAQETSKQGRSFGLNIGGGRVWNGPFLKVIYFCLNVFFFFVKWSFVLSIHKVGWLRNCNKVIG